jgi:argininosuccinate lyase
MLTFMNKLWAGRFRDRTEKTVESFTESVSFDARLWPYDIEGSIAHVRMLGRQKILSGRDAALIVRGLKEIRDEITRGDFIFHEELEDVHMNIEKALTDKIGPAGGKIHTARSRNDQVALDLRLYLRDETGQLIGGIKKLQKALLKLAEKHIDIVMPGYTHLQRAQPLLLSHHLLAYYEMLDRDRGRLEDCLKRINVLPLGSAALSGTTFPIDRRYVAELLKFPSVSENSVDAVSDRDFVAEFIAAAAVIMMHLSRLAEECILWNSEEFRFIELPDAFTTGSSIMPQKKNPDVLELTRGKTGRVYGNLMSILTIMKSLPLAYNRDMQEDKIPLFDTVDTVRGCVEILCSMLPKVKFNKNVMEQATVQGFLTATDIAEYLVKKGVPFREAHGITGNIVAYSLDKGVTLEQLSMQEMRTFSDALDQDIFHSIRVSVSVDEKKSYGGTSRSLVEKRIRQIKKLR